MKNLKNISVARYMQWVHDSRRSLVAVVVPTRALHLPNQLLLDPTSAHALHHRQMLEIVMRLKESITSIELDKDAANAPNVARIAPSQIKNDLRCPVVPCRNDCGVVFVVKCCGSKVDESDLGVE